MGERNGFSTNSKIAHDLWQRLQDNTAQIRKLIGSETKAVSSSEWSMNAGAARILRHLPSRLKRPDRQPVWLEIWVNSTNSFSFVVIEFCYSGYFQLRKSKDLSNIFSMYKDYSDTIEYLKNEKFFLVKNTLYPERIVEGQVCKTGQWFEYWYHDLDGGKDIAIVTQTKGDEIQVIPTESQQSPIVEFNNYEETCQYLWQEDYVKASGRCAL